MRFVLGLLLGFGVGFAGAILLAPEKKKRPAWPPNLPETEASAQGNGHRSGLRGVMNSVRGRLDEAMSEAREAQKAAERDMMERYEKTVKRNP